MHTTMHTEEKSALMYTERRSGSKHTTMYPKGSLLQST